MYGARIHHGASTGGRLFSLADTASLLNFKFFNASLKSSCSIFSPFWGRIKTQPQIHRRVINVLFHQVQLIFFSKEARADKALTERSSLKDEWNT